MGNNLLELTGVSAEFQRKRIIDTINLAVPKRSRVSIIGTSGCGKSTLLKLIAGLLRASCMASHRTSSYRRKMF